MTVLNRLVAGLCTAAFFVSQALAAQSPGPAAVTSAAPTPARIPIEALAEIPSLANATLSPDGFHIAAMMTTQNRKWIGIWDLHNGPDAQPRQLEQTAFEVRWIRWAGPSRLLLGVQITQHIMGFEVPVTRILSLDIAAFRLTALQTGHGLIGDDVIFTDPQGAFALVASQPTIDQYPSVLRIDLATGEARVIQRPRTGVWDWFADQSGTVRAGVDYSNNRITLYYRNAPDQDLRRIDSRRYPQDGSVIDMIRFVDGADRGVITTNSVTGRFAVYNYDFANDTRGDPLFEHPQADVTSAIMGSDGRVTGVAYEDERRRIHWLDAALQRLQQTIDRALPDKDNLILDRSDDGNRILIWSTAANDPGTYYVFDRANRRIEAFASPYMGLIDHQFSEVRPITFHSRQGTDLHGYLTLPRGRADRNLPLVLMPHGGPFLRDSWEFDPWVQFLASRGYAVLQVNFRGSTGYGRAFVESGFGQWGSGMIDDLEDGVDWLAQQGTIDPHRVCVMGGSYGGYVALWAPIRNPDRYRCAISFAGVTDVRAQIRYDNRVVIARRYTREWRRKVEGEERADLSLISPLQQAARLTVPVLIAHGERDQNVPVRQSRDLIRAISRAGTNSHVETVFYPEEAHGFTRPADSVDFLRRVETFLAKYNPAEAAATVAARSSAPAPTPSAPAAH